MSGNIVYVKKAQDGKLKQEIKVGNQTLYSDEMPSIGGDDQGPNPHDLLNASLGACTALTVLMVARRKQWPLQDVRVEIAHEETDTSYTMHRNVELVGDLTAEQRQYLLGIANKCPIHRALHKKFEISTELVG
jgi:putative redox protein